jgi:hypothetical protein
VHIEQRHLLLERGSLGAIGRRDAVSEIQLEGAGCGRTVRRRPRRGTGRSKGIVGDGIGRGSEVIRRPINTLLEKLSSLNGYLRLLCTSSGLRFSLS